MKTKITMFLLMLGAGSPLLMASKATAPCGDGVNTLKTWTNSTNDGKWETAGNWSPSGVPDCDDDVQFTTNLTCNIKSAAKVRDIIGTATHKKTIFISGAGNSLTARDITFVSSNIQCDVYADTFRARNISFGNNGFIRLNHAIISGTLTVNTGTFSCNSNATVDINNLILNSNALFRAPDNYSNNRKAVVKIRGNLTRVARATFDHQKGCVRFVGTTNATINTNNTELLFWNLEIDKKADGAGDITTPGLLYVPVLGAGKGTILTAINRLSLQEAVLHAWRPGAGTQTDAICSQDSIVVETTMANNTLGITSGTGTAAITFKGAKNGTYLLKTVLPGVHQLIVNKDRASYQVTVKGFQEVSHDLRDLYIMKGVFAFDGSKNAKVNGMITVLDSGQLIAPDDDTLFVTGAWKFRSERSFNPQNGTFCVSSTKNISNCTHNGDTVNYNNVVFLMKDPANPTQGRSVTFANSTDFWMVKGDFTIPSSSCAYVGNSSIGMIGNIKLLQTVTNTYNSFMEGIAFYGNKDQTVEFSANGIKAIERRARFYKTGGTVTLLSDWATNVLELGGGVVVPNGFIFKMNKASGLSTPLSLGSATSYVNGPMYVSNEANPTTPFASLTNVAVGKGGNYAPLRLVGVTGANTFKVEYFNSGYVGSNNTVNAPLDTVQSTYHWKVERVAGTSSYRFQVASSRIPSYWGNTKRRVAYNTATSNGWINGGAMAHIADWLRAVTNTSDATCYVAPAIDKDAAQPFIVTEEGISGTEVATERTKGSNESKVIGGSVDFVAYPNPVSGMLNVALLNADKGVITVSDMTGKVLGIFNAAETKNIDFSALSSGLYNVNFTNGLVNINRVVSKQ